MLWMVEGRVVSTVQAHFASVMPTSSERYGSSPEKGECIEKAQQADMALGLAPIRSQGTPRNGQMRQSRRLRRLPNGLLCLFASHFSLLQYICSEQYGVGVFVHSSRM